MAMIIVGSVLILCAIAFHAFYRYLPSTPVSIETATADETLRGNAVLISVSVVYSLNGRRRVSSITLSGYRSKQQKLREKAKKIREYYSRDFVLYHHLPFLKSLGLLENPVRYRDVWGLTAALVIYVSVVYMIWRFW